MTSRLLLDANGMLRANCVTDHKGMVGFFVSAFFSVSQRYSGSVQQGVEYPI